jgi:serine phosphatase RsbU (regulator of sigma subunit)
MKRNHPIPISFLPFLIACFWALSPRISIAQTHTIDSLLTVLESTKEDTSKALIYNGLCRAYMSQLNDMEHVQLYAAKAFAISEPIHFKKGIGFGIFYMGLSQWTKGDLEMALNSFKKASVLLRETVGLKSEGACYINIGQIYTEQGKHREGLENIQKGVAISEQLNDRGAMQSGYLSIGNVYSVEGNYTQALHYFLKSLRIAEELNDQIFCSLANNNIGDVFYAQNKFDMALVYYKKAVKHMVDIKEERVAGSIYTGMGNVYWKKKQYKEALIYHLKDLRIKEDFGDKEGIAVASNRVGSDYFGQQKFEKALSYQLKSYNLCKQIGYKKGLIDVSGGVGKVYEEQKEFTKALAYFNEMLTIAKELSYREGVRDAYENLASVYRKLNEFEKALAYTERFHNEKDSLLNKENFKQVAELNTRYETDKKEKEILLLTKDQDLNAKTIKQQQLVRWGLIGGLGLLSVSIFSIFRRYRFKQKANVLLEKQKEEIQQKNILITDSIDYAKTIQEAVLPTTQEIKNLLPESFIVYKPKAIVSGDFYWLNSNNDQLTCAVADCTGHGVPGAFMSLLGYNMLEDVAKMLPASRPAFILNALNQEVMTRLSGDDKEETIKHGMDISLISIDPATDVLEFAGAHNSLYIVRGTELIELKADKINIGGNKQDRSFTNQFIELNKGDMIYLFTDGFPDQIGGPNRKKFYYQPFKELLISISKLKPEEQKVKLDEAHTVWMGEKKDQTDDILIMGIRYS